MAQGNDQTAAIRRGKVFAKKPTGRCRKCLDLIWAVLDERRGFIAGDEDGTPHVCKERK